VAPTAGATVRRILVAFDETELKRWYASKSNGWPDGVRTGR